LIVQQTIEELDIPMRRCGSRVAPRHIGHADTAIRQASRVAEAGGPRAGCAIEIAAGTSCGDAVAANSIRSTDSNATENATA
jgi:hypothetical protein